jgi:branched-subunit amino acid transport protein
MADEANAVQPSQAEKSVQFRLSTIFVLTLVAGILAAFLSPHGNDLMLAGLVTTVTSLIFALAVGYVRPPLVDRVFWGIVVAAMMQAVCANVILLDRTGIYAWPLVAGFAAVAAAGTSNRYGRMLLAAATAGLIIFAYIAWLGASNVLILAYVTCASVGGALLTILVDVTKWLEQTRRIPPPAIGLALVLAAIGFSVVAPTVIPGW